MAAHYLSSSPGSGSYLCSPRSTLCGSNAGPEGVFIRSHKLCNAPGMFLGSNPVCFPTPTPGSPFDNSSNCGPAFGSTAASSFDCVASLGGATDADNPGNASCVGYASCRGVDPTAADPVCAAFTLSRIFCTVFPSPMDGASDDLANALETDGAPPDFAASTRSHMAWTGFEPV